MNERLRALGFAALAGFAAGATVYALVSGARPLYEATARLAVPSRTLLEHFNDLTMIRSDPRPDDAALEARDLGDFRSVVVSARRELGLGEASGPIDIRIDRQTSEVSIAARHFSPEAGRRLADAVAEGLVLQRARLLASSLDTTRAELALVSSLASRSRRLRARADSVRRRVAGLVQLQTASSLGVTLLRRAERPTERVAPRLARDVAFAGLLAMLGVISAGAVRRRLRSWIAISSQGTNAPLGRPRRFATRMRSVTARPFRRARRQRRTTKSTD